MSTAESRPLAVLQQPELRRYLTGNLLALFGTQMQTAVVSWELYERTQDEIHLGLIGMAQVVPYVLLAIPAGQLIDRWDRRRVIQWSLVAFMIFSIALAAISYWKMPIGWIYVCLVGYGAARAFHQPAKSAFLPTLVSAAQFAGAVTLSTAGFQLASVVGPSLGGLLIKQLHQQVHWLYLVDAALCGVFVVQLWGVKSRGTASSEPVSWRTLLGGLEFVWRNKLILGALSLDMFAYMFGGAVALLPIYSKILEVDESGYGWLRAAAGVGAIGTSIILAYCPPMRRAGPVLLWVVAWFGVATIIFGFSRNFWLSWWMLFLTGALDMVSVVIRHTLVQTSTPDAMRGRVSAVNGLFINISNELGAAESGLVARWFKREGDLAYGPTVSVVSGGIGSLLVVLSIVFMFPALRRYDRLGQPTEERT